MASFVLKLIAGWNHELSGRRKCGAIATVRAGHGQSAYAFSFAA
jgi:hypothetical protein